MADASERQVKVKIDAGGEQIDVLRLEATEALSRHFELVIDVLAPLDEIDWLKHMGKPGSATLFEDGTKLRSFHGIVVGADFVEDIEGAGFHYRLTLRPKAYLHEHGRYYRIFQKKTVKEILKSTLDRCGIDASFDKLEGGTRKRAYCVQYGESDFSFACRLMEEEGIYYYYAHTDGKHTLTLCSTPSAHPVGAASPLKFSPDSGTVFNADSAIRSGNSAGLYVQSWHERVSSGGEALVTMRDFDFQQSSRPLEAHFSADFDHPEDKVEVYAFPGRFYVAGEGTELSEVAHAARRAERRTFTGVSKLGSIACGTSFALTEHSIGRFNASYLVTRTRHSIQAEHYRSGMGGGMHQVQFEAILASVKWKAPQITPRPTVAGPETAIVVGPPAEANEGINVDKYGRVQVQFHWDRDGRYNADSSCWIRVSQTGGLGNIIIPRVGHEVLVDFINGDPDRPIVVGRVFNDKHMPTYSLPENKTRAVWRTKRYGDTGKYDDTDDLDCAPAGVNEIRLEDKGGSEEFFIYAERDLNTRIRHAETHHVGNDQEIKVGHDRIRKVTRHETIDIGKNRKGTIGDTDTLTIKNKLTTEVELGDEERKIGANQTIKVGKKIAIEAGDEIKLTVGDSVITMTKQKITIESGKVEITGMMSAKMSAAMTNVEASGVTTVKGGMVKIN